MKIISIIKNDITGLDLAVSMKDNFSGDDTPPTPPRNATTIAHTKSGLSVLQVEFWRNSRFQKYFWFGEPLSVVVDEDTNFYKRGRQWLEFLEIYESI